MMPALHAGHSLIDRLPPVRGRYAEDAPLAHMTWFRVGGPAEVLFRPADPDDLAAFLSAKPADVPVTVLGVASNTLIRDGGVPGVVVRLGRGFTSISVEGDVVTAGAGALCLNVAMTAARHERAGLEFLSGIPGSVGGALRMNAGAYGGEVKDVLIEADLLDPRGRQHRVGLAELDLGYRRSAIAEGWIALGCRMRTVPGPAAAIRARITEIAAAREASQPLRTRTGGSTFKNPPGARAWELIDAAGCRGLAVGGAQVSEKHCNFLVNTGDATAADLEALGEEVRRRVLAASGIELEWEIRRVGVAAPSGREAGR